MDKNSLHFRELKAVWENRVSDEYKEMVSEFWEPLVVGSIAGWGMYYASTVRDYLPWLGLLAITAAYATIRFRKTCGNGKSLEGRLFCGWLFFP